MIIIILIIYVEYVTQVDAKAACVETLVSSLKMANS